MHRLKPGVLSEADCFLPTQSRSVIRWDHRNTPAQRPAEAWHLCIPGFFFGITGVSGYTDSSLVWVVEFCHFPSSTVKRGYSKGVVTLHQTIGRESVHPKPKQKSLLEIFPGIVEIKKSGRRFSQIPPLKGREFEGGNGATWHGLYLVTG